MSPERVVHSFLFVHSKKAIVTSDDNRVTCKLCIAGLEGAARWKVHPEDPHNV